MDGIEAARRIRDSLGRNCPPIIALTADLFVGMAEGTQTTPFDDHLAKPVIAEALEGAVTRCTGGDPGSGDTPTDLSREISGTGRRPAPAAGGNPLLPPELEEQLHGEILRLHTELERLQDRPTGEEFTDFAHQLAGLAGLYGLEELATIARELEQAARNNLPQPIAPALQRLASIVASLLPPVGRRS